MGRLRERLFLCLGRVVFQSRIFLDDEVLLSRDIC